MTNKNKFDPEIALLNQVTDLLMYERVKQNERQILLYFYWKMTENKNKIEPDIKKWIYQPFAMLIKLINLILDLL